MTSKVFPQNFDCFRLNKVTRRDGCATGDIDQQLVQGEVRNNGPDHAVPM